MSHAPSLADLAVRLAADHALSARPDAPVVVERPRRRPARRLLAAADALLSRLGHLLADGSRAGGRTRDAHRARRPAAPAATSARR
ncbi:MAG TPA: hypothetical protein VF416_10270 [Marmoricola sp.]